MRTTALLIVLLVAGCAQRGFPPVAQIVNLDRVGPSLWRGGQPNAEALRWLAAQGVRSVINLRDDPWAGEESAATNAGLAYVSIPLSGLHAPSRHSLEVALACIERFPPPVFVHCQWGCDRTGTVVACWRIQHGWTPDAALQESELYGLSGWELGMRRTIRNYRVDTRPKNW